MVAAALGRLVFGHDEGAQIFQTTRKKFGLAALARKPRTNRDPRRKLSAALQQAIEGLAFRKALPKLFWVVDQSWWQIGFRPNLQDASVGCDGFSEKLEAFFQSIPVPALSTDIATLVTNELVGNPRIIRKVIKSADAHTWRGLKWTPEYLGRFKAR